MKKALTARCTLVGGILLTFALAALGADIGTGATAPPPSAVASAASGTNDTGKQKKLAEDLEQGAQAYKNGNFEAACGWYKSALQLDPSSDATMAKLQQASKMREARERELKNVPSDPKAREQFLSRSYAEAANYFANKQYDQAANAFNRIWLVAGNYKGQTAAMIEQCNRQLQGGAASQPAPVPVVAVANVTPAAAPVKPDNEPLAALAALEAKTAEPPAAPVATTVTTEPVAARIPPIEPVAYEQAAAGSAKPAAAAPADAQAGSDMVDDLTRLQVTTLLHNARELNEAGKVEEARKNVNQALTLWPDNADAKALLAALNQQLGYASRNLEDTYLTEGDALSSEGKYDQAALRYDEALKLNPASQDAAERKAQALKMKVKSDNMTEVKLDAAKQRELDQMQDQALKAYEAKDVKKAREIWQRILQEDPQNKPAQVYLEQTKAEADRIAADQTVREHAEKLSEQAEKLLGSPVSISTDRRMPLDKFMNALSYATPVEMEYSITGGAKAEVYGNFQNKPLRDVLDTVLLPIGLSWSINENNVIVIDQKLITKTYTLSTAQMSKVRALSASGDLQKSVWGQADPPAEGCAITLDERQNMMVVTGSKLHIQRIESLLPSLKDAEGQEMQVRIYKINEKDGPRIKTLINSIISASNDKPFDLERKIFIDKDDLIIRDTPDNIKKIEELLLDKKFINDMTNQKLDINNFSLVPRDTEVVSDQIRAFTARVVEAIKVFLYSQEGESKAMEEGRRLWYDPYTLQLTIVDTPANLARVGQYIEALPELGQKTRQEVVFLTYAVAEDLSASLERILDITSGGNGGPAGGNEVVFKLRQGEERQWRNIRLRVLRVRDPNRANRGGGQRRLNEGNVEFTVDNGYQSENRNMQELTTEYVDDYRITIEDVTAQAGDTGAGSARFRITYIPQLMRNQMQSLESQVMPDDQQGMTPEQALEQTGISINPFGELNALIIRYTDPAAYKDVMDLIAQLDKPMNQVSIETKFVEVNETRAKEFSADFDVAGLGTDANGQSRNLDWNTNRFNSRFAQDQDEFRDIFSPPIENPLSANLIKGTTVLNAVIGNQDPLLNFSLRFLEAEGVLNMVNGPKVTSLDGQEAVFRIEMYNPNQGGSASLPTGGSTPLTIINPLDSLMNNFQLADYDEADNQGLINAVVLRVTPEITSNNSIILNELSAELVDYEGWLGESVIKGLSTVGGVAQNTGQVTIPTRASSNIEQTMLLKRKRIETNARVSNGGTIILGGWTGERSQELTSGVPILRNMPYLGKLLFSRAQRSNDRTTLMIFLTCYLVE